ncbi:iron complex outermembrane receptor protein [Pedobacter sp. UYP30]|uniref:TonB-dependent receptor n=1 Tax=Pedobacter sp. UYP30 TaxID=1756400 RepID=UPI003395138A
MKNFLFLALLIISAAASAQQNIKFEGGVLNYSKQHLPNVLVQVINTSIVTKTDADGNFTLSNLPSRKLSLKFSAVGYADKVLKLDLQSDTYYVITLTSSSLALDDIVVSSEKSEQKLQELPASVTSLSAQKVEDYRIQNTRDLAGIVPNLYSSNPGDGRNITSIRGIGTTSYDQAVATYIDGVNQFGLDTYIASLFDVESIEVLRGPQGTLYGRNAMGGVINIITKKPTNTVSGFLGADFGKFGQQRYSAGIRLPLVQNHLYFGAAGLYSKQDGFYTNTFNNAKFDKLHGFLGNYYLKYIPTDKFSLTLNVKHNENRNNGTFPLTGSVEEALKHPFEVNQNAITEMVDNLFNASLSANYYGDKISVSSQTAYQNNYRYYTQPIDGDFSPIDGVSIINNYGKDWNKVQVYTQEFKFSSPATFSKLKWLGGLYGFYQTNPVKQGTHFGADGGLLGAPFPNFTTVNTNTGKGYGLAAFGQLSYSITPKLLATLGLRYDYEHKKLNVQGEFVMDGADAVITQKDTAGKATFKAFSPKFSLAYKIAEQSNLYASYSRGFRAGGITQLGSDPSVLPLVAYKPEYSDNYEIGIKNEFLDQKLRLNLSYFYINLTDAQVPVLILPDAVTVTKNAGKLHSEGVEMELAAKPVKGLDVAYNLGYADAVYKTLSLPVDGKEVNYNGNRQVYTPSVTSSTAVQYSYQIKKSSNLSLLARGEWFYIGNQFYDLANRIEQKGYSLLNAKIGVSNKNYEIYFWGRNLDNKTYIDYAYDFGAAHLGNPRTFGLSVKTKF